MKLSILDFYRNFRQYADNKTSYSFAKKCFAQYLQESNEVQELYTVENNNVVCDEYKLRMTYDIGLHTYKLRWSYDNY